MVLPKLHWQSWILPLYTAFRPLSYMNKILLLPHHYRQWLSEDHLGKKMIYQPCLLKMKFPIISSSPDPLTLLQDQYCPLIPLRLPIPQPLQTSGYPQGRFLSQPLQTSGCLLFKSTLQVDNSTEKNNVSKFKNCFSKV